MGPEINIDNFKRLRDYIAKPAHKVKFNMNTYLSDAGRAAGYRCIPTVSEIPERMVENMCGTAACIAGEAAIILASCRELREEFGHLQPYEAAGRWLGLTPVQASYLFTPNSEIQDFASISKKAALHLLDKIIRNKRLPVDKRWWPKSIAATKGKPYK